jgi:hypothetical protein
VLIADPFRRVLFAICGWLTGLRCGQRGQSFSLDRRQYVSSHESNQLVELSLGCIGSGLFGSGDGLGLLNAVPCILESPMRSLD